MKALEIPDLYTAIRSPIARAQAQVVRQVNTTLVDLYWHIGQRLVEAEQGGAARAEYGQGTLRDVAARLTAEFGKGYEEHNLHHVRQFYQLFPIRNALRSELSWSHYRLMLRIRI